MNPANGKVLAHLPSLHEKEIDQAIQSAHTAWKTWKETTAYERSKILQKISHLMTKYSDDLAAIITLEAGKPTSEAKGEIGYAISFIDFYAEEIKRVHGDTFPSPSRNRRTFTIKQPVGPVGLITPWNFPSAMITRKVAPALAAGCTVVLKPSEETPLSALAMAAICHEAGVPPGVLNIITVGREDVTMAGSRLCHSPLIRKISFTGSTVVGKWLMREASTTVKKVSLELGGNAAFIVFDDADLDIAVQALMLSKFRNAGQACIASNRVFVQQGVYKKFADRLSAAVVANLRCGYGFDAATTVGPLINAQGLNKVHNQVEDCKTKGAKALVGGQPHGNLNALGGFFYEPTVLVDVTKDMLPFTQETFGPIVPLIPFTTEDEVVDLANDTPFGLSAYFCTKDLRRAFHMAERLEAGMVGVNEGAISFAAAPFGGVKESGLGREGGAQGLEEYLEEKYVCIGGL
eukprot:scaffold233_cov174-Ochromonas_danica.AAC.10